MRESGEFQFFPVTLLPESDGGENGRIEGGEGAGELVVLDRLEGVGGIEGEKEADGGGAVRGDGAEQKGEIEPRPGPRFPGQILDGDEGGERRRRGRGGHGGKQDAGPRDEEGGPEETEGSGDDGGGDPGSVHVLGCSGEWALGEGEAD
jgi:hypothetical protein